MALLSFWRLAPRARIGGLAMVLLALLHTGAVAREVDPKTGDHLVSRSRPAMGTLVVLTAWTDDEPRALQAFEAAFAEIARVESLMTTWRPDSEISHVNAAAGNGRFVPISDEVATVLRRSLDVGRLTRGAFDITVGVYGGIWKFDEDRDGTLPDPKVVEERRRLVDYRDVVLKGRKARLKRAGQKVTLGGIAKGYGVDRAVAELRRAGLADFLVQAGGDMYVAGRRGDRKWRVGIRDPRSEDKNAFFAFADVEDHSFSTSGDYERFVLQGGKRYHHILDPRTGQPAMRSRSVTVMAPDAFTADALDTAFFVMGPEAAMKIVESLPDVEAVFVGPDNRVTISSGLRDKVTIVKQPTDGP